MNRNPKIMAIIPIIIVTIANKSKACLMLMPINNVEIPKNNRLKPTMTEINSDENMGNIMNNSPNTIAMIPALLLMFIVHLHL